MCRPRGSLAERQQPVDPLDPSFRPLGSGPLPSPFPNGDPKHSQGEPEEIGSLWFRS